jgi:hypothetical protein
VWGNEKKRRKKSNFINLVPNLAAVGSTTHPCNDHRRVLVQALAGFQGQQKMTNKSSLAIVEIKAAFAEKDRFGIL